MVNGLQGEGKAQRREEWGGRCPPKQKFTTTPLELANTGTSGKANKMEVSAV